MRAALRGTVRRGSTLVLHSCRSIEWSSWLTSLIPRPTRLWWSSTPMMRSRRSLSPRGLIVGRRENRSIPGYGLLTVSLKHATLARCELSRHRRLRWRRAGSRYASRASATDVVAHRRSAVGARAVLCGMRGGAAPMGPEPHPDTRPDRSGPRCSDGLAVARHSGAWVVRRRMATTSKRHLRRRRIRGARRAPWRRPPF